MARLDDACVARSKRRIKRFETIVGVCAKIGCILLIGGVGFSAIVAFLKSKLNLSPLSSLGYLCLIALITGAFMGCVVFFSSLALMFFKSRLEKRLWKAVDPAESFRRHGVSVDVAIRDNLREELKKMKLFSVGYFGFTRNELSVDGKFLLFGQYGERAFRSASSHVSEKIDTTSASDDHCTYDFDPLYDGRITILSGEQSYPGRFVAIRKKEFGSAQNGLRSKGYDALVRGWDSECLGALNREWIIYADKRTAETAQRLANPEGAFYQALAKREALDFVFMEGKNIVFGSQNEFVSESETVEEAQARCEASVRAFLEEMDTVLTAETQPGL